MLRWVARHASTAVRAFMLPQLLKHARRALQDTSQQLCPPFAHRGAHALQAKARAPTARLSQIAHVHHVPWVRHFQRLTEIAHVQSFPRAQQRSMRPRHRPRHQIALAPPAPADIRVTAPVQQCRVSQDGRRLLVLVCARNAQQVRMPERGADLARSVLSAHFLLRAVHRAPRGGCAQLAKVSLPRAQ